MTEPTVPDYSGESDIPPPDSGLKRLNSLVLRMAQLQIEEMDAETKLEAVKAELKQYRESLIPELMVELGVSSMSTAGGIPVEMVKEVRAGFPKDSAKQQQVFRYLKDHGDDGLIKREFTIAYGRDSIEWAEKFAIQLESLGVGEHAEVREAWNIHHQTLLAYVKKQLEANQPIPFEPFGIHVQKIARIKK